MMTQNADKKREQVQFLCMDDMVPKDHLLRIIDKADIVNIGLHFFLKNVRPYATSCSEA